MGDYTEHLISMAGGDGEPDLDAIQARITDCRTYKFGMRNADKLAHEDAPALLAVVRSQQAQIERVRELADRYRHTIMGHEVTAALTATEGAA